MLTFGSLFAGIGGFDLGFERASMRCLWQCEKDRQATSVLANHWPDVPRYDDVETMDATVPVPDVLCGGFPCQDLSVAGRRRGLAGERSGLFYAFAALIDALAPRWVVIENVPGLLSSHGGRDMGAVLGTLGELGYGFAYRVLDAQYFGVAQRRRRVFIVGRAGDGAAGLPARVLFEPESVCGGPPPRREAGADVARTVAASAGHHGYSSPRGDGSDNLVAFGIGSDAVDRSGEGAGGSARERSGLNIVTELQPTLRARPTNSVAIATHEVAPCLQERDGKGADSDCTKPLVMTGTFVRRLTPRECERLQGFPDDWTRYAADGREIGNSARYRMLGNAVAVPVAEWIGHCLVEFGGAPC